MKKLFIILLLSLSIFSIAQNSIKRIHIAHADPALIMTLLGGKNQSTLTLPEISVIINKIWR